MKNVCFGFGNWMKVNIKQEKNKTKQKQKQKQPNKHTNKQISRPMDISHKLKSP